MALNHLFWSEKNHTGLHLVPCSSWHRLKHAILLSSILCVTFQVSPVVPAKAQFPLARTVITSADKNVCFQFKPTQFHLAPVLTLLGSRDSAAAAGPREGLCRATLRRCDHAGCGPCHLCQQPLHHHMFVVPWQSGHGAASGYRAAFCPTK